MQPFVSVIIDSFSLAEGSGLLTAEQSLMMDMRRYFKEQTPHPKPEVPDGWRSNFCYFFLDARPLPVPAMKQCIEQKHIPNNRFIADVHQVRRQIDITKQSVLSETDPAIIAKLQHKVNFLQGVHEKKAADVELLKCFSKESLENNHCQKAACTSAAVG